MDRWLPPPAAADLALEELYRELSLAAGPPGGQRAGLTLGMVSSVDGATAVEGISGGLGGTADAVAFGRLRGACDAILVGAGTVRAEEYGPPGGAAARRDDRTARGLAPVPALIVVTRTASLAPDARLFTDPRRDAHAPVVVATCEAASQDARTALAEVAEVVEFGADEVDLAALLAWCRDRGWDRVLCEGGPGLNGQLAQADLVDEVMVTLAPQLASGPSARLLTGPALDPVVPLTLAEVHHDAGELLLRYLVER